MWSTALCRPSPRPILITLFDDTHEAPPLLAQGRTKMKNLNFLTHQEIFDRAVHHLFGQGQAALLPRGGGAYRGYCGGCPVGSFIKPRDYMAGMEGVPIRCLNEP